MIIVLTIFCGLMVAIGWFAIGEMSDGLRDIYAALKCIRDEIAELRKPGKSYGPTYDGTVLLGSPKTGGTGGQISATDSLGNTYTTETAKGPQ